MPPNLDPPLDPAVDHVLGKPAAPLELVMFADFQCPYCLAAQAVVRRVRERIGDDLRFAFRHLPVGERHPQAQLAAEASEAAAGQDAFWPFHDALYAAQSRLTGDEAVFTIAGEVGLDVARMRAEVADGRHRERVERDVRSARAGEVAGTPGFFVNGTRHDDVFDAATLTAALRA